MLISFILTNIRIFIEMFFVIISISIYNFGIYLILVLSNCNAIQSTDCHVRYFNKLSIYLSISNHLLFLSPLWRFSILQNYFWISCNFKLFHTLKTNGKIKVFVFSEYLFVFSFAGEALQDKITTTKTLNKKGPSAKVEKIMMKKLELEYDFYNFVKARFHIIKAGLKSVSS